MTQIINAPKIAERPSPAAGYHKESGTQTFWMSRDELMQYFERARERHRGARKTDWSKSRIGIDNNPE